MNFRALVISYCHSLQASYLQEEPRTFLKNLQEFLYQK